MNTFGSDDRPLDVVTIGETMLRFSTGDFGRLEQSDRMQVHVGGSESNTAVGLARLGARVAWLSRLTSNPMGRRIAGTFASHGVNVEHVLWTDEDRVGTYYYELGMGPRPSQVIYDRANSAFSRATASMLPRELFRPQAAKLLHITGISMALGPSVREMIAQAVVWARQAGWLVSYDVNHRHLLWGYDQALAHSASIIEQSDVLFVPKRDAIGLWGRPKDESDESSLKWVSSIRGGKPTVMTLGDRGAIASVDGRQVFEAIEPVDPIGRLGGGDAFSAGFLFRWLQDPDLAQSLRWGTATARLKYTIPGDLPIITRREVEQLVERDSGPRMVR